LRLVRGWHRAQEGEICPQSALRHAGYGILSAGSPQPSGNKGDAMRLHAAWS
jgi:hypothetical protein